MLTIPPVSGLLVSQIGYDLSAPMRAIYRGPSADAWPADATFSLHDAESGAVVLQAPLMYWGECWRSHWWIADFSELKQPGSYRLALEAAGIETIASSPFVVGRYRLWDAAVRPVGIDQFEARAERARFGNGWKDCGAGWREASSHSAALIGLLDLIYIGFEWLGRADAQRLAQQIMHGCDFLVLCQKRAADLGLPPGALIHELPESAWAIPQDHGQAVVALARAARYLYEVDAERSNDYLRRAVASYEYLTRRCAPGQLPNFSPCCTARLKAISRPRS
ncbi:MAG: hypothetical protein IPK19_06590 [Chloroflexi bacterium]|nr:hypothetical protein [Chloroflexota bacterium]